MSLAMMIAWTKTADVLTYPMCRNIKPLFNFDPPTTDDEVRAAAIQFVRKISGFSKPSETNKEAFEMAIDEISVATQKLLKSLKTSTPAKDRGIECEKEKTRNQKRFGK